MTRILLTGGDTGGHIYPLVSIIRALKDEAQEEGDALDIVVVTSGDFGEDILKKEGVRVIKIKAGKLDRFFSWKTLFDFLKIPFGFLQALFFVWKEMPDVILGNGGSVSVAVGITGWLYRIPLLIHESDAVAGLANRILSPFASRIGVSFARALKKFPEKKTGLVGNPIRGELAYGTEEKAREIFELNSYKSGLLVLGGSQGAKQINDLMIRAAPQLLDRMEIIHQYGTNNKKEFLNGMNEKLEEAERKDFHPVGFLKEEDLGCAYAWADLVVARAGAGLIFELAALGVPSILIPLASAAGDHQKKNAYAYSESGACRVIESANLSLNLFVSEVKSVIDSPDIRKKMSEAAFEFSRTDAGQVMARGILHLAGVRVDD